MKIHLQANAKKKKKNSLRISNFELLVVIFN